MAAAQEGAQRADASAPAVVDASAAVDAAEPEEEPERPAVQRPEAPTATPPVAEDETDPRKRIKALMAAGRFRDAEKELIALRRATPEVAWVRYLLGEVYFQRVWRKDALEEWDEALKLQPGLKHDRDLQKYLCTALDARSVAQTEELIAKRIGTAAVWPLKDCIRTTPNRDALRGAVRVLERLGASAKIDRVQVALRELDLARTCEDRRFYAEVLGRLKDRRALVPLGKLEKARLDRNGRPVSHHVCLGTIVKDAMARIR
jgi:hypothetical protein